MWGAGRGWKEVLKKKTLKLVFLQIVHASRRLWYGDNKCVSNFWQSSNNKSSNCKMTIMLTVRLRLIPDKTMTIIFYVLRGSSVSQDLTTPLDIQRCIIDHVPVARNTLHDILVHPHLGHPFIRLSHTFCCKKCAHSTLFTILIQSRCLTKVWDSQKNRCPSNRTISSADRIVVT